MNAIDGELFGTCLTQRVSSLGRMAAHPDTGPEVAAVDGKTSRHTHDRTQDRSPLHLVSAWASSRRLVLGQQAGEAKSDEITAIPRSLDRSAIRGALVTIVLRRAQDGGRWYVRPRSPGRSSTERPTISSP